MADIRTNLESIARFTESQLDSMTNVRDGITNLSSAFGQLNELLEAHLKFEQKREEVSERNKANAEAQARLTATINEEEAKRNKLIKEQIDSFEKLTALEEERTEQQQELYEIEKELKRLQEEYNEEIKKGTALESPLIKLLVERAKAQRELRRETEKSQKAQADISQETQNVAASVGGSLKDIAQSALGLDFSSSKLSGFAEAMGGAGGKGDMLKGVMDGMGKSFSKANMAMLAIDVGMGIITGVFNKFAEATLAAMKTTEDLGNTVGREFGAMKTYADAESLMRLAQQSKDADVTFAAAAKSAGALARASRGLFGNVIKNQQALANFVSEMEGFGVSIETSAKLFGEFGHIMGKDSVEDIKQLEEQAVSLAHQFNRSSEEIISSIGGMASRLAEFGGQAGDVALQIQKIGLAAGVSGEAVLEFGNNFAYLPNALESANQLNLIFQKNAFDGVQMFRMLQDGAEGQAAAFDSLLQNIATLDASYFGPGGVTKRRSLMASLKTLGIDQKESARLLKTVEDARNRGLDPLTALKQENAEQAKVNDAKAKFVSLSQKLIKLQDRFAVALAPVADKIGKIVDYINALDPETLKLIVSGVLAVGGALVGGGIGFLTGGPIGAAIGAIAGGALVGGGGLATMSSVDAFQDGILFQEPGKNAQIKKITTDPQDTIVTTAFKPGGPLAKMSSTPQGNKSIDLKVDLFGERLISKMVDLIDGENGNRRELEAVRYGTS